jgi:uncharacterized protein YkwD
VRGLTSFPRSLRCAGVADASLSLVCALLAALAPGCASHPPSAGAGAPRADEAAPAASVPMARFGPDRAGTFRPGPYADAKTALLARINADRAAAGLGTLEWDAVAAKAGDAFCLDAARTGVMGHWDLAGRAPYDRYADAGGVDWNGENFSGTSRTGSSFHAGELVGLLLEAHGRMMAEKPPDDGHRKAILDPSWTHVGIGVALTAGEFRMTEEFTRHAVVSVEAPAGRVRAGRTVPVNVQLPKGWKLGAVQVAHEPFPRPLTAKEIQRRSSYAFPAAAQTLLPLLGPGLRYASGAAGEVEAAGGLVRARIPLASGPGSYWVLVFAGPDAVPAGVRPLTPSTAVRITAD